MKFSSIALALPFLAGHGLAKQEGPTVPPKTEPKPTENFSWADPFASARIKHFTPTCTVEKTFSAFQYELHDLFEPEPVGLGPYGDALKVFFKDRDYPGGWDGMDPHGYERPVLKMGYADVPIKVREWIEEQERTAGKGKGLFAVYEASVDGEAVEKTAPPPKPEMAAETRETDKKKVVIFAPGAVYDILPLWVVEGNDCQDALLDLSKYKATPEDQGVIAWTTAHTVEKRWTEKRGATFTVTGQVLKAKEKAADEKDEL